MECKNCSNELATNQKFCHECGGKVIVQRITFKTIFAEILDKFFNIDNKFYQTFIILLKQPQEVIEGFIDGKRAKYFNPISYFAFALTLSGLYYFLLKKGLIDYDQIMQSSVQSNQNEMQQKISMSINKFIVEYSNLVTLLFIPVYVLFTKILFSKYKKYNWAEHFIINIYLYSEASIISSLLLLFSFFNTRLFLVISGVVMLFQFLYFAYSLKKIFGLNMKSLLLRTLLFFVLVGVVFFFIIIIGIAVGVYLKSQNII